MSATAVLAAVDGAVLAGCGALAAALIRRQRDRERLYGRSRGLRFGRPRRRVPGLPWDPVALTGEEEAAFAAITAASRRGRRARG